jgi:O-succinylbenzoate synthase
MNVRLDRVELVHIRIPLHSPFKISSGIISEKDAIVVKVFSDGLVGYGESSPMAGSFYSTDSPESTWACLEEQILPRVLGGRNCDLPQLLELFDDIEENGFAKAGIETAFWDIEAKKRALPLYKLLGGTSTRVPSGLAVGIYGKIEEFLHTIEKYLPEGYKRLKIKIEPGWDVEPVRQVRQHFGDIPLMVDANAAYSLANLSVFKELDEYDLQMFEQPFAKNDLEAHAELQRSVRTPVCLDESAIDPSTVERAISLESCKIVNIKIQRVGGLSNAKKIHDLCRQKGIAVWAGTMPELGIGSVQTIHLATLENFRYPTDVQSSYRWFVDDIIEPWIEVNDGWLNLPETVGYGFAVDEKKIQNYTVHSETFR